MRDCRIERLHDRERGTMRVVGIVRMAAIDIGIVSFDAFLNQTQFKLSANFNDTLRCCLIMCLCVCVCDAACLLRNGHNMQQAKDAQWNK